MVGWCVVAPMLQGAASATLPGWVHFAMTANFAKHPPQPDSAAEHNRAPAGSQRTGAVICPLTVANLKLIHRIRCRWRSVQITTRTTFYTCVMQCKPSLKIAAAGDCCQPQRRLRLTTCVFNVGHRTNSGSGNDNV